MSEESLQQKAAKGVFWKFMERIFTQLMSTIVSIILARILLPEDYAAVSIVAIFFSFCNIFINNSLASALVQKKEIDSLDVSTAFIANVTIAFVLYGIVFVVAPIAARIFEREILVPLMRVMGLSFFIYMIKAIASVNLSRDLKFKKFFFITIVGTIISGIIGAVMALKGAGPWALAAQQMSNALIDTILLFIVTKTKITFKFSFKRIKPLARYSWKLCTTSFIDTIYLEIKPLIIGIQYTTADLAYYNKAENYPRLIANSIEGTFSSVLTPVFKEVQDDYKQALKFIRRFFSVVSYLIFPAMLGFAAISHNFVEILLTDKWLPMVPYLVVFCCAYMMNFIVSGVSGFLKGVGRTDIVLKNGIIMKSVEACLLLIFIIFSNSAIVVALSVVFCVLIEVIVSIITLNKLVGYRYRMVFSDIMPNLLTAFVMFILVVLVGRIKINVYLSSILQVGLGIVVYLFVSFITKNNNLSYLYVKVKTTVKTKKAKSETKE